MGAALSDLPVTRHGCVTRAVSLFVEVTSGQSLDTGQQTAHAMSTHSSRPAAARRQSTMKSDTFLRLSWRSGIDSIPFARCIVDCNIVVI